MTDAVGPAAAVHDRKPLILRPSDHDRWQHTDPDDALALCAGYTGEIDVDRTAESWRRDGGKRSDTTSLL